MSDDQESRKEFDVSPRVVVRITGGNQMFLYAAGLGVAVRNNLPLYLGLKRGAR